MKKICPECLSVYVGFADIEKCPLDHCEGLPLVAVDDLYVDAVKRFLKLIIKITRFDAGTLEEDSRGPLICFVDTWYEGTKIDIEVIRELALKVNDGTAIVNDIRQHDEYKTLMIKSKYRFDDMNPVTQLECHVSFVKYLYRLLDKLENVGEHLLKFER